MVWCVIFYLSICSKNCHFWSIFVFLDHLNFNLHLNTGINQITTFLWQTVNQWNIITKKQMLGLIVHITRSSMVATWWLLRSPPVANKIKANNNQHSHLKPHLLSCHRRECVGRVSHSTWKVPGQPKKTGVSFNSSWPTAHRSGPSSHNTWTVA